MVEAAVRGVFSVMGSASLVSGAMTGSPVMDSAVGETVVGKVRADVRIVPGRVYVEFHAEAGLVAGVQEAVVPCVGLLEDGIRLLAVLHVLLYSEVVDRQ